MYGSLLIMENMLLTNYNNMYAYARHLSFMTLKSSQHFTSESILAYDNGVRSIVEATGVWPPSSDSHLANCHLVRTTRPGPVRQKDRRQRTPTDNPAGNKCIRFNTGTCDSPDRCKYGHKCFSCAGSHPITSCKVPKPKSSQ